MMPRAFACFDYCVTEVRHINGGTVLAGNLRPFFKTCAPDYSLPPVWEFFFEDVRANDNKRTKNMKKQKYPKPTHLCSYAKELTPEGRRKGTVLVYELADIPHAMQQKYFMWTHRGWLAWHGGLGETKKDGVPCAG